MADCRKHTPPASRPGCSGGAVVPDGARQASSATRRRTNDIAGRPQRQPISHRTTRRDSARRAQSRRLACVALPITTRPYPATRAPPSRQILARSSGAPRGPRAPATGQAARWSPSSSKAPPQRQCLGMCGSGSLKRCNKTTRMHSEGMQRFFPRTLTPA